MSTIARKHYLVLPSYQLRLIGFLVIVMLIGSLIHGFFLYKITAKNIEEGFFSAHNRLRSTWEILKPAIVVTNGISFLLVSLSLFVVTVFVSHRLIGPVFKVAGRIQQMTAGKFDLPPIKLRKGDEGKLLSDAVNDLQKDLQSRFNDLYQLKQEWTNGKSPSEEQIRQAVESALKNLQLGSPDKS